MTILVLPLYFLSGAYMAGFLGSLTGLGGGVIIIPLLTLVFMSISVMPLVQALLASIATSSGAASAYVKEGITNIRLGMFWRLPQQ